MTEFKEFHLCCSQRQLAITGALRFPYGSISSTHVGDSSVECGRKVNAGMVTCPLMLLLFTTWIFFAQARWQGGILDSNHKIVSIGKGLLDGEHAVTAAATSKNWLGGRKMVVLDRQMKKLKDVKMSGATVGGASKFSTTNSKCGNNLGCEHTVISHFSDEVDESGFTAFNADYHEPRHHPPKNN